VSEMSG